MRRMRRIALIVSLLAAGAMLAGCEEIDMDKFDLLGLNKKKPLPGERHDLFPGGVPGVTQGIPQEYMKSNVEKQQQLDSAAAAAAVQQQNSEAGEKSEAAPDKKTAAVEPAEKPKPKRKVAKKPKPPASAAAQPSGQQGAWPVPGQQPQQQQPQQESPWPSSPPPGTFSR